MMHLIRLRVAINNYEMCAVETALGINYTTPYIHYTTCLDLMWARSLHYHFAYYQRLDFIITKKGSVLIHM